MQLIPIMKATYNALITSPTHVQLNGVNGSHQIWLPSYGTEDNCLSL